jgi:hypothetical protein
MAKGCIVNEYIYFYFIFEFLQQMHMDVLLTWDGDHGE